MKSNNACVAPIADIENEIPTLYSFTKAWCVSQVGKPAGERWNSLVSFINGWGAKQWEAGRQAGRSEVAQLARPQELEPTQVALSDLLVGVRAELIQAGIIGPEDVSCQSSQHIVLTDREKFEKQFGPKDSFSWRNPDDTYKNASLQQAWVVWQAAIAAQAS